MASNQHNTLLSDFPWPPTTQNAESAGDDGSNYDSAIDMKSTRSSVMSIGPSVFQFKENGRLYCNHKGKQYFLPTDEKEQERQRNQQRYLCHITLGGLSLAPLRTLRRVLDVGTGTGSWAFEFAEIHREAWITGIDLAPLQPEMVPENLNFQVDDLEKPWTFRTKFDYIHCAIMAGSFEDWPRFIHQAFENLNPDGHLEIQDFHFPVRCDDGSMPPDCNLVKWSDLMMEAATKLGFPLDSCAEVQRMMKTAGFVDVVESKFTWPQNSWPQQDKYKALGEWVEEIFVCGLEAMSLALFTRGLGWSKGEVTAFIKLVELDMRDQNIHSYWYFQVVYGRKP